MNQTTDPTIVIEEPAPGVFLITGHNPKNVQTDKGLLCVERATVITPELPSEVLFSILEKRGEGAFQKLGQAIDLANGQPSADDELNRVCNAIPGEFRYLAPAQAVTAIYQDLETVRAGYAKCSAELADLKSRIYDGPAAPLPVITEGQKIDPNGPTGKAGKAGKPHWKTVQKQQREAAEAAQ